MPETPNQTSPELTNLSSNWLEVATEGLCEITAYSNGVRRAFGISGQALTNTVKGTFVDPEEEPYNCSIQSGQSLFLKTDVGETTTVRYSFTAEQPVI